MKLHDGGENETQKAGMYVARLSEHDLLSNEKVAGTSVASFYTILSLLCGLP